MPPYLLLALLLSAIYSTLFYLWRGKNRRDLLIYLLAGLVGFLLGQGFGNLFGFQVGLIGPLHVLEASLVSLATLTLIQWLKL
jgi:uncharacterized membrane protein YfcA